MTTDVIKTILADIIGTYDTTLTDCIDWEYIAAATTFLICLWFTFSLLCLFLCLVQNLWAR